MSKLSIVAFILSFTYFLSPISIILAIIDLIKNRYLYRQGLSIAALVIGGVLSILLLKGVVSPARSIPTNTNSSTVSLNKTTPSPTKEPVNWKKAYYVDDFGDPTTEWYLQGKFKGTFSNTATTGSNLTVYFIVEPYYYNTKKDGAYERFRIKLLEYDDLLVNFRGIDCTNVIIKVKIEDKEYQGQASRLSENYIYFERKDGLFAPVLSALQTGKEIKFVIVENQYTTSTYRFNVNSYGLKDIEHSWK